MKYGRRDCIVQKKQRQTSDKFIWMFWLMVAIYGVVFLVTPGQAEVFDETFDAIYRLDQINEAQELAEETNNVELQETLEDLEDFATLDFINAE